VSGHQHSTIRASGQRNNKAAIAAAGLALVLSTSFLLGRQVVTDEAGGGYSPQQHGLAYDFWLASITIAFAATLVRAALEHD
jgi:hypothetical protein